MSVYSKFTFLFRYFLEEKLIDISHRAHRWFTEIPKIFDLTNNKKPKGSEKISKNSKIFGLPKNQKPKESEKYQKTKTDENRKNIGKAETNPKFFGIRSVRPKTDPIRPSGSPIHDP